MGLFKFPDFFEAPVAESPGFLVFVLGGQELSGFLSEKEFVLMSL